MSLGNDTDAPISSAEVMAIELARRLHDGEVGMTGASSDIPVAAALLAQQLHAPNLTLVLPSGAVNPRPGQLYRSASDGRWFRGCEAIGSAYDLFELSENHQLDFMFYGGIQLDPRGNINLTEVHTRNGGRFRGPGLANISFAVVTRRIFLYTLSHTARTFVEKLDYLTAPGHLDGNGARERAGIHTQGPELCVTPLGTFDFNGPSQRMNPVSYHEGIDTDVVRAATGFDIGPTDPVPTTTPPSSDELEALRQIVDRSGVLRKIGKPLAVRQ